MQAVRSVTPSFRSGAKLTMPNISGCPSFQKVPVEGSFKSGPMHTTGVTRLGDSLQFGLFFGGIFSPIFHKHMWEQEKHHLKEFEKLIPKYRVRPTILLPLWNIAGLVSLFMVLLLIKFG